MNNFKRTSGNSTKDAAQNPIRKIWLHQRVHRHLAFSLLRARIHFGDVNLGISASIKGIKLFIVKNYIFRLQFDFRSNSVATQP